MNKLNHVKVCTRCMRTVTAGIRVMQKSVAYALAFINWHTAAEGQSELKISAKILYSELVSAEYRTSDS